LKLKFDPDNYGNNKTSLSTHRTDTNSFKKMNKRKDKTKKEATKSKMNLAIQQEKSILEIVRKKDGDKSQHSH